MSRLHKHQALQQAPLTWDVAAEMPFTRFLHPDPGDRFLVATARVYDLTLVTADEGLIEAPDVRVLAIQMIGRPAKRGGQQPVC